jgi:hypothetical protein
MSACSSTGPINRLSPEILTLILEKIPRTHCWHKDLLPLLTVCKDWKVNMALYTIFKQSKMRPRQDVLDHIFYQNVTIGYIEYDWSNLEKLVNLIRANHDQGRFLGLYIRRLDIYFEEDTSENIQENVRTLLGLASNLQDLEAPMGLGPAMLSSVSRTSAHTLTRLSIGYDTSQIAYLSTIGQLQQLRRLIIECFSDPNEIRLTSVSPWTLSQLESLMWHTEWDQEEIINDIHAITFLVRCSFPRLRKAILTVPTTFGDGTAHLLSFLREHPHIQHLDIVLEEARYPMVLPHITASQLDVTSCQYITPLLVDYLPSSITSLSLPVYLNHEPEDVYPVLQRLLTVKTAVRSVELSAHVREDWIPDDDDERLDESLYFGRQDANLHPVRAAVIGSLFHYSIKLREKKDIHLYDEDMMTFEDYTISSSTKEEDAY